MLILVVFVVVIAIGVFVYMSGTGLSKSYAQFETAQSGYEEAAYKPGAEENPVRQEVNMLLSQVLQVEMTQQERIDKARQGITRLNDMEEQIDEIKAKGDVAAPLLDSFEKKANSPAALSHRADLTKLIALSKRQAEIISDIRGLSYRADYHTTEVFERIIDDAGEMTDAHKTYLNDQIPQLEEQFNKRTNLYTELENNRGQMNALATKIGLPSTE